MNAYLKIKIKSLAAEAAIIRKDEIKFKRRKTENARSVFWGLRWHRTGDVRWEARASLLAYGFLRGRTHKQMEPVYYEAPIWSKVEAMITKYGTGDKRELAQKFAEWKEAHERSSLVDQQKKRTAAHIASADRRAAKAA